METDWASENLLIIRTLMERSAVYRHALAPVMAAIGLTGIAAAALEAFLGLRTSWSFAAYWMSVGLICVIEAFVLTRWQAVQKSEPFWSPPTRRVAQAMSPAFFAGFVAGLVFLRFDTGNLLGAWLLVPGWMVLYGCALHAAGFFMPRGFKLFGWGFIIAGCLFGIVALFLTGHPSLAGANWAMGAFFGGSHWAYAIYLYFTEKRRSAL
jgi:hypothetical protein